MAKKKPTPDHSNGFKQRRNKDTRITASGLGFPVEGVSFFKFMNKLSSLSEDAEVRDYSPQALGRKRNMFLNTLALDDTKFLEWVQNRLYRIAYDNKRSMSDFTPKDIEIGLNKWEALLRNGDPGFGKYQSQFASYKQRFMKAAATILANAPSGRGSMGVEPHEAPPLTPQGPAMTPSVLKHQANNQPQSQPQSAPNTDSEIQISPEEQMVIALIQDMQNALAMKDAEFENHVQNKLLNNDIDPITTNEIELERKLDEDFQNLLDSIPMNSPLIEQRDEIEQIYSQYKERFILTTVNMGMKAGRKIDSANKKQEAKAKSIGKKTKEYEVALVIGMASILGQQIETTGLDAKQIDLLRKNPDLYGTGKRMAANIISNHPELSKSVVMWTGAVSSQEHIHAAWEGKDISPVADIIFDIGKKRIKYKKGKFVGCGNNDKDDACSSKIKLSMKLGDADFSLKNAKETTSIFNRVVENLANKDYDLSDAVKLSHRLMADGMEPEQAKLTSVEIVEKMFMLKNQLQMALAQPEDKAMMDFSEKLSSEMSNHITELSMMLPSFVTEFVYVCLTGDGKFSEGSDLIANYIVSTDFAGDKVILVPASREIATTIANQVEIKPTAKSTKIKSNKDPLLDKYMSEGLTKEDAEHKISLETPYRLWDLVRKIKFAKEQKILMNPEVVAEVLRSNDLINFVNNIKLLKEEEVVDDSLMPSEEEDYLDPDTRDYVNAAIDYAFSSFQNMIKFFGIKFNSVTTSQYNIYNMFASNQVTDMKSQINNRVDMNNMIGDELQQMRLQNESTLLQFRRKVKELYNL